MPLKGGGAYELASVPLVAKNYDSQERSSRADIYLGLRSDNGKECTDMPRDR